MVLLLEQRKRQHNSKWFMMTMMMVGWMMMTVVSVLLNESPSTSRSSSFGVLFVTAQPIYISQICPTSKHHLLSLVPADDDNNTANTGTGAGEEEDGKNTDNTNNAPVYKIYDGDVLDDEENLDNNNVLLFRECTCPRPTGHPHPIACPLDSRFCAIPTDTSIKVMCYSEDASVMVVRNIWPLMCLWYLCFILFVCCSYKGRQAVLYCFSKCLPQINVNLVDRMLQRQRRQWTLNFWSSAVRAAQTRSTRNNNTNRNNGNNNNNEEGDGEGGGGNDNDEQVVDDQQQEQSLQQQQEQPQSQSPPPRALELKTKKFDFSMIDNNNNNEEEDYDEDDHCCTICFVPIEEGDKIGDLPSCNHMFHVECIKIWLQRKNTCPLCAAPMAKPSNKYNTTTTTTSERHQQHRSLVGANSILASLGLLSSPSSLSSQAIDPLSPTQSMSPTSTIAGTTPTSTQEQQQQQQQARDSDSSSSSAESSSSSSSSSSSIDGSDDNV